MYRHHIVEMTKVVGAAIGIKGEVRTPEECEEMQRIEKALEKYWANRIAIVWGVEDIVDRAKDLGKRISKNKAHEILEEIHHHHDATLGINWDVIDTYL